MQQFFLSILLFLMFFPALLSLLTATRKLGPLVWNFFWYYIMAQIGVVVFESQNGMWAGLGFALLYLYKAIFTPAKTQNFQFIMKNMRPQQSPPSSRRPSERVLDAEFVDVTDKHKELP